MKKITNMSKVTVVTAVEPMSGSGVKVFLAGGIQKCKEWQKEVIKNIQSRTLELNNDVTLINPRRDNFPIHDPNAADEHIAWEFGMLEVCDVFSMYFDETESDQPICFYELGRNIERMKQKFPDDWEKRIVVSCNKNFRRWKDVVVQTRLATDGKVNVLLDDGDVLCDKHSTNIIDSVNSL